MFNCGGAIIGTLYSTAKPSLCKCGVPSRTPLFPHPITNNSTFAMASSIPSQLAQYRLNSIFGENTVTHTIHTDIEVWNSEKVLGSGTFGKVWRQREDRTGELRAVKVISKSHSDTQELQTLVNLRDVCPPHPRTLYLPCTLHTTNGPSAFRSFRPIHRLVRRHEFHPHCDGVYCGRRSLSIHHRVSGKGEDRGQSDHATNSSRACGIA